MLQQRLRSLEVFVVVPGDELRIIVPPEAQRALKDFKDALLDSADHVLGKVLQQRKLDQALRDAMVQEGYAWSESERWVNGAIEASVVPISKHRDRWAMVVCILLEPGTDCMLAIYERREKQLRRSLVVRSDMYSSIEAALHGLTWTASPPDANDDFYLVEAHTYPWPSSRWRDFSYRALIPAIGTDQPRVIAEAKDSANLDAGFELDAQIDRFTIRFSTWSNEAPNFTAPRMYIWHRKGDDFQRATGGAPSVRSGGDGT